MNNDFNSWYLALLRKQVEEEIQFLNTNGHNQQQIQVPCMFCIDSGRNYYTCHRMKELKRFLSSIVSHGASPLRVQHERKKIGYEMPEDVKITSNLNSEARLTEEPLLNLKF